MILGANLDLFWSLWETLGYQFGDFLGYSTGIEIWMNFMISPETPQVESTWSGEGKKFGLWSLKQPDYSLLEPVRYDVCKLKADKLEGRL